MIDKYIKSELKKIKLQAKLNNVEEMFLIELLLAILFILVLTYISNIPHIQIMMLFLTAFILFLLFTTIHYYRNNKIYEKLINEIRNRFKDN